VYLAAHNLLKVHNLFLDIAQIETGRFQRKQTLFHPRECIEWIVNATASSLRGWEKEVTMWIDPNTLPLIGDEGSTKQILVALVENAIIYSEKDTAITLAAEPYNNQGQGVLFTITYVCRQPNHKDRLTQALDEADNWSLRTELELALSKRICDLMGGRIWVEETKQSNEIQVKMMVPALVTKEDEG
jgi:signal transduction histidine kinase